MPELPEVETICKLLRQGTSDYPPIIGRMILGARLFWLRTLVMPDQEEFQERVIGQVINDVARRGKFLLFSMTQDTLLLHLRMSGDLRVEPENIPIPEHHRIVLDLDNGYRLAFNDPRKFGRVWVTADPDLILGSLGPEPLDPSLTNDIFFAGLRSSRRKIKSRLLDQGFLAGLGNIYVDEALHLAQLHPLTPSNRLDLMQSERLLRSIRTVIEEGIQRNGASIDWVYRGGGFQNFFRAYQRTGQPCPECGTPIERILVGQRGTHFCPKCQVLSAV